MRLQKLLSALFVVALAVGATGAWAHGGARVGVYVGPSFYWGPSWPGPYYYPYPYYPPQVVVVPAPQPPVYIEQNEPPPVESTKQPAHYWYYCKSSKAYYPYVKECPDGWQKVLPQPEK